MDKTQLLDSLTEYLKAFGVTLPDELKRRDKREPGRKEKENAENELYRLLRRYWKRQQERILEQLERIRSLAGKGFFEDYYPDSFWSEENQIGQEQLTRFIEAALKGGIDLFGQQEKLSLDYSLVNQQASKVARELAGELIKGVNKTTKDIVRNVIQDFVNLPGYTIGDIVKNLPYSEDRALKIAVTEVTKAYARANILAGEALQKQYPKVKIVKTWFTNADDRVCPICQPLDGKKVLLEKEFTKEISEAPAHINCRCWISVSTEL